MNLIMLIQDQAQCPFVDLKAKCGKCVAAAAATLTASHASFHRYKASVNVHTIRVSGEAVCADTAVWGVPLRLCNKSLMRITSYSRFSLSVLQDYFGRKCQTGQMLQI